MNVTVMPIAWIPNEILITGIGVVSAAGGTIAETLASFDLGTRNAGPVFSLPDGIAVSPVFEVKSLPEEYCLGGPEDHGLARYALIRHFPDART